MAARYRLAVVLQKQDRHAEAVETLRSLQRLSPRYVPAHYSLGESYAALGDTAAALSSYESFLERWSRGGRAAQIVRDRIAALRGTP